MRDKGIVTIAATNDFNIKGMIVYLPQRWRPFYLLAHFDRPAGWHLLYWPCCFGLALAVHSQANVAAADFAIVLQWAVLFLCGAICMRSAGCIWNDILDRDLDRKVERTRHRPLAAKIISVPQAIMFCGILLLISLVIFLLLPMPSQIITAAVLPLALIYPLMKRVTSMPQLILGMTFNWGALSAYSAWSESYPSNQAWLLWTAGIFWTLAYDTIYACQDKKDDEIAGIKSLTHLLRHRIKLVVALWYLCFALFFAAAFWQISVLPGILILISVLVMLYKLMNLDISEPKKCLQFFRANVFFAGACGMAAFFSPLIASI